MKETFLDSSLYEMKKAIIEYNNFLSNDDRISQFIIHAHIAFNRIFIWICLEKQKKFKDQNGKTKDFDTLVNIIKSLNFFCKEEIKTLKTLNKIRNTIQHSVPLESEIADTEYNFIFLTSVVSIYNRIIDEMTKKEKVLNINIIHSQTAVISNKLLKKNWYENELINANLIFANGDKNTQNVEIQISNGIFDSNFWKNSTEVVKKVQDKIPDFQMNDLVNISKVYSIFTELWKDPSYKQRNKYNPNREYADIVVHTKLYNLNFITIVIKICKKYPDFNAYFKLLVNKQKHLNISDEI